MKENSDIMIDSEDNKKNNGDYAKKVIQTATEGIEELYKMKFDHRTEVSEKLLFGKDNVDGVNQILGKLYDNLKDKKFDKKSSTGQFVKDCEKFTGSKRISLENLKTVENLENELDKIYDFLKSVKKYKRFFGSRINPLVKALDKLRIKYDKEKDKSSRYFTQIDGKDVYTSNAMTKIYRLLKLATQQLETYNKCKESNNELAMQSIVLFSQNIQNAYLHLCRLAIDDLKKLKKRKKNENKITTTGLIPWYDDHKNITMASAKLQAILDVENYLPKSFFKSSRLDKLKSEVKKLKNLGLSGIIKETKEVEENMQKII